MKDELIGRFVFVGTKPGTVIAVTPGAPAVAKTATTPESPATPEMISVKLHDVPNKMRDENVVVEVERTSSNWRLKYPEKRA